MTLPFFQKASSSKCIGFFSFLGLALLSACSSNDSSDKQGLKVFTYDTSDSSVVKDAYIDIYENGEAEPKLSGIPTVEGSQTLDLEVGSYRIKASAQGYDDFPKIIGSGVVYTVKSDEVTEVKLYLNPIENTNLNASLKGKLNWEDTLSTPAYVRFSTSQGVYSTYSNLQGQFVLLNIPETQGTLEIIRPFTEKLDTVINLPISSELKFALTSSEGNSLEGQVSFLATSNAEVDVTLIDPQTNKAITGLKTISQEGRYQLVGIPEGEYLIGPSYEIDGYVLDPDWVVKNGQPIFDINQDLEFDFSVTGAVQINAPVFDTLNLSLPIIDKDSLIFKWLPYSSADDYVIEVRDAAGNLVWGGFSEDFSQKNISLGKESTEVAYNSDQQGEALVKGEVYSYKIYACKEDKKETSGFKIISVSEEGFGVIKIKP